jgi:hypothetical protein
MLSAWLEQLLAESSGKQGMGIVPVAGEALRHPEAYGNDRLFVYFRRNGIHDANLQALRRVGHPVVTFDLAALEDLAVEFYRWEFATAAACAVLGVNAFDQPNVQDAKARAKAQIAAFQEKGRLDRPEPCWQGPGVTAWATEPLRGASVSDVLSSFLAQARKGHDYIAINAFLPRTAEMQAHLGALQAALGAHT